MPECESTIHHAMVVLGKGIFFEIIGVSGLGKLAQTCRAHRYLQLEKKAVVGAIVGSTHANLHLEGQLSLFGMFP